MHLIRRLGHGLVSLFLLFTFVFFAIRTIPGDPATLLGGPSATATDIQHLRHALGLDRPLWGQYLVFVSQAIHGNLGTSIVTNLSVTLDIGHRFPATLELASAGMLLATVAGILGGLLGALRRNTAPDAAITAAAVTLTSMPAFWLAILLIDLFSVRLGLLPSSGMGGLPNFVLPAIVLAATQIGMVLRITRSSVLEVSSLDYVRTAQAKGLPPRRIWGVHILRNALVPIVTIVGLQMGLVLGGAVITESVFNWPGIGQLLVSSVLDRDYPVIQGLTLLFGFVFIAVNIVVDVLNTIIDPTLRSELR